jgi:3-hydroxybutyryl-CoA dehydratase
MKIKVGDTASVTRTITHEDIEKFAELSGDRNRIHLDADYAKTTRFGKRIAHGMLTSSLISNVIGNQLPGLGSIYLGQTLQFLAPVFPGDTIIARATVTSVREDKPIVQIKTVCTNQNDQVVIRGEATVLVE